MISCKAVPIYDLRRDLDMYSGIGMPDFEWKEREEEKRKKEEAQELFECCYCCDCGDCDCDKTERGSSEDAGIAGVIAYVVVGLVIGAIVLFSIFK